jgi:hypothetical protein
LHHELQPSTYLRGAVPPPRASAVPLSPSPSPSASAPAVIRWPGAPRHWVTAVWVPPRLGPHVSHPMAEAEWRMISFARHNASPQLADGGCAGEGRGCASARQAPWREHDSSKLRSAAILLPPSTSSSWLVGPLDPGSRKRQQVCRTRGEGKARPAGEGGPNREGGDTAAVGGRWQLEQRVREGERWRRRGGDKIWIFSPFNFNDILVPRTYIFSHFDP